MMNEENFLNKTRIIREKSDINVYGIEKTYVSKEKTFENKSKDVKDEESKKN